MRNRVRAFTLLECLVALLVIASSLLVFDGLSRYLSQEIRHQAHHQQKDWLIFAEQFQQELDQSELVKVENHRLYIRKNGQELAFAKYKAGDFRKTNWQGQGYQPMLQDLEEVTMQISGQILEIDFMFKNGMERRWQYAVAETD